MHGSSARKGMPVNRAAAIIFYLIFIVGIFIFVISPAVEKQSVVRAIVPGAISPLFRTVFF